MGNASLISADRQIPSPKITLGPNDLRFFEAMDSTDASWRSQLLQLAGDFDPRAKRSSYHPYFRDHPRSMMHELAAEEGSSCIEKITELVKIFGARILNNDDDDADDEDDADDDDDSNISRITPLYIAVDKENFNMVKALIRLGAELEVRFSLDIPSVLYYAVQKNAVEMALLLLACGASPHACEEKNHDSLLKIVKSCEIAEALITMGADVNRRSTVGWTNLHTTPFHDNVEVIKTLVANGANPRARDGDAKTTPRNSAFISDESKQFLSLAEKYIKWYRSGDDVPSGINNIDLQGLQQLRAILDPLVLTDEKRAAIRDDLFALSILRDRQLEGLRQRAVETLILCVRRKGYDIPSDVLRYIKNDFLSPEAWETSALDGGALERAFAYDEDEYEYEIEGPEEGDDD